MRKVTKSDILEFLDYNPKSGLFIWKPRTEHNFPHENFRNTWNSLNAGKNPGFLSKNGYTYIDVCKRRFLAHRLAWFLVHGVFPKRDIDHINGNRTDNRITNLRLASRSENLCNAKIRSDNTSGFKGVSFRKDTKKWSAKIKASGKPLNLGCFDSAEEAAEVVNFHRNNLHGAFANQG